MVARPRNQFFLTGGTWGSRRPPGLLLRSVLVQINSRSVCDPRCVVASLRPEHCVPNGGRSSALNAETL